MKINLILAYDHLDDKEGDNFLHCKNHILQNIDNQLVNCFEIDGNSCKPLEIQNTIIALNEANFIFVAYSHGNEDALVSTHGTYLNVENAYFLSNSLFYSSACLVGVNLANRLIEQNCLAVVAYEDEFKLPYNSEYDKFFIECENYGIIQFLTSDETLGEIHEKMIEFYNTNIDELYNHNAVAAQFLTDNRDNLIVLGDKNLQKVHFINL